MRRTGWVQFSYESDAAIVTKPVVFVFDKPGSHTDSCSSAVVMRSSRLAPLRLFLNRFPETGGYLRINLIGRESNRLGIGARIEAEFAGRKLVRELFTPMGFMGQSPPELLIGTGDASVIDRLTIRWPGGITQQLSNVAANQELTIHEEGQLSDNAREQ